MKILKFTARMFDTYGMEDLLFNAFVKYHKDFLKDSFAAQTGRRYLNEGKLIRIGTMRIGELLDDIVERHGPPTKKNYPRTVTFALVSPYSSYVKGEEISAFFSQSLKTRVLYIVKVTDSIDDIKSDDYLKTTFLHELQHLIRNMYSNDVLPSEKSNRSKTGTLDYYHKQSEIQSFCAILARRAVKAWIDVNEYGSREWTPEKILSKIQEWKQPNTLYNLFNLFVLNSFAGAFKNFDEARDNVISSDPELKKKYLYYTFRNVEVILNRYLDELEAKTMDKLSLGNIGKREPLKLASVIRLWLDDERDPSDPEIQKRYGSNGTEIWVKSVDDAINCLQKGAVKHISFDNDLGEGQKEGRHLAAWIEEQAYFKKIPSLEWNIHSENPNGRQEILMAMSNADRFWSE